MLPLKRKNLHVFTIKSCHPCFYFQGREPTESPLYAEHDRRSDRVCSVVLRVPSARPAASLQIIERQAGGEPSEERGQASCVCVCICIWICVCVQRPPPPLSFLLRLQPCSTINSEMNPSGSEASADSNKARGCGCEDVTET